MLKRSLLPLTAALVVALAPTALRAQTNRLTLGGAGRRTGFAAPR
jgi:hypothetical protein